MIIRTHIEPTNVHPIQAAATQSAISANQSGNQNHFDAALLQAAKAVQDSAPESTLETLSPKVQQALAATMAQLNQEPLANLQKLAQQPQALANLASNIAQANGLNKAQTAQLKQALSVFVAFKTGTEVQGKTPVANSTSGTQPGPQGGTPAATASPSDFTFNAKTSPAETRSSAPAPSFRQSPAPGTPAQTAGPVVAALPQAPIAPFPQPVPASVNTGTSQVSAPTTTTPAQPTAPAELSSAATFQLARVITVAGNGGQTPNQAGFLSFASDNQASPLVSGAGQAQASNGASPAQGGPAAQASAPIQGAAGARTAQGQAQPQTTAAGTTALPALPGLELEVSDPSAPLAVQEGTQVTLKGDGTWVFPEAANAPARQDSGLAPQVVSQATAPSGAPAAQPTAPQPAANRPAQAQPLVLAQVPVVPEETSQAVPGEDTAPSGAVSAQADSANQIQNTRASVDETQAQGAWAGIGQPQDPTQIQAGQLASAQVQAPDPTAAQWSQAPASWAANQAQLPVLTQGQSTSQAALPGEAPTAPSQAQSGAPAAGNAQAGIALNTATAQAQANRLNAGFSAALASTNGQGSVQPSIGQAQGEGTQQNVSQQVLDALDNVAGNPGRLTIQLKPANLGAVQVDLSLVDGKLTARLVTSQSDVRDVLVRDLAGFKASLESHGVIVNEVSVAVRAGVQDQQQGQANANPQNTWRGPQARETEQNQGPAVNSALAYGSAAHPAIELGFSALA